MSRYRKLSWQTWCKKQALLSIHWRTINHDLAWHVGYVMVDNVGSYQVVVNIKQGINIMKGEMLFLHVYQTGPIQFAVTVLSLNINVSPYNEYTTVSWNNTHPMV